MPFWRRLSIASVHSAILRETNSQPRLITRATRRTSRSCCTETAPAGSASSTSRRATWTPRRIPESFLYDSISSRRCPPNLIVIGGFDPLRDEGLVYVDHLKEQNRGTTSPLREPRTRFCHVRWYFRRK